MIALAGIAMILALAVPPIARVRERRRNMKALAALRAALAKYAAETKTKGPSQLSDLTRGGKYLAEIPSVEITGRHRRSAEVHSVGLTDDSGGWTYSNWPGDSREGSVWINCTHTDNHGTAWKTY